MLIVAVPLLPGVRDTETGLTVRSKLGLPTELVA
jgi:hypothetical protein